MAGQWAVCVMDTGHVYIHDPNEFYLTMGRVVESHKVDSKEEAEALKNKLKGDA